MRRWIATLSCLLCLFASARPAFSEWANVPLEELVADSDIIVVATLRDIIDGTWAGARYSGTLIVQDSLWGAMKPGEKLTFCWHEFACGTGYENGINKPQIWLLKRGRCGIVKAHHPDQRQEITKRTAILEMLRSHPLRVTTKSFVVAQGGPAEVTMIFQNATSRPITFPAFAYRKGQLWLPPHSALNTIRFPWEALPSEDGSDSSGGVLRRRKTAVTASDEQITVEPRQEYRVTVNLADLYKKVPENFGFALKGFGKSNFASFSILSRREYAEWQKANVNEDRDDSDCDSAGAFHDQLETHWAYQAVSDIPVFLPTPAPERRAPSRMWLLALLIPLLICRRYARVVVSKPIPF